MIRTPHKRKANFKIGTGCSGWDAQSVTLDNTGDITIGNDVIFTNEVIIYTHEHYMSRESTITEQTKKKGVKISGIVIGNDVYFGSRCMVMSSVTNIPNGTVIAAGALLTKNPQGEYEIWAGVPAKKIGERN